MKNKMVTIQLTMITEQDRRGTDAMLFGNLDDRLRSQERPPGASQRAVGDYMDAFLFAKVDDLLLRKAGVVFDLVHGGDDGAVRQELLEIPFAILYATSIIKLPRSRLMVYVLGEGRGGGLLLLRCKRQCL